MESWTKILRTNFRSVATLAHFLQLTPKQCQLLDYNSTFPLNLPVRIAEKMAKGSTDDPLFLQYVPLVEEKRTVEGFGADPVQEQGGQWSTMLHKYKTRVLLLPTSVCAMHCRYCFRRHFPYASATHSLEEEIATLRTMPDIEEVIFSGGDPLSLPTVRLARLVAMVDAIPHITRIRWHSRFILGIPERINTPFLAMIRGSRCQHYFVLHSNHINTFDAAIWQALARCQQAGMVLLNQSVLLKGVNDTLPALQALMRGLIDHGVLPYYVHQLDRVAGAAHFEVDVDRGRALIEALYPLNSGYGAPRYVQEVPNRPSKTPLT